MINGTERQQTKQQKRKMADSNKNFAKKEDTVDFYEDKKSVLTDRLQKRDEDRLDSLSKKREEKESSAAEGENTKLFFHNFQKLRSSISEGLVQTSTLPQSSVAEHLGKIAKDIDGLKKYITDATIYLPSYDIQKSQLVLGELQSELQKAQDDFLPKKKFGFKARSKASTKVQSETDGGKSTAIEFEKFNIEVNEISIRDEVDVTKTLSETDVNDKDIVLTNLHNCTVIIQGVGSSMQIDKLTNCRIICGPISRSVFIYNCQNCTFILACQQLRVHHTTNTSFFIHVTTRAIIEDTTNVKFGQYCQKYQKFEDHWIKSGLDRNKNNWNDIDDFNYLASDSKSPNWNLVTAAEQSALESSL